MKKETSVGIAKWLSDGNTGLSSKSVLMTFLNGEVFTENRYGTYLPSDLSDFYRIYKLIKYAPEVKKGIKILSKHNDGYKNILKFWDELCFILNNRDIKSNTDFYEFLSAVINVKYGNSNYQKRYDDRQKKGRELYKKYGFNGKRIPTAPISN